MMNTLPVKVLRGKDLVKALSELSEGEKTEYLINAGTQRQTLREIDTARSDIQFTSQGVKFAFGKLIKNGQNVFQGIRVLRVAPPTSMIRRKKTVKARVRHGK